MSRIIAIDYGTKRSGIAVTDPLQLIASGLTTVPTKELNDFLLKYLEKEEVECIVVGEPKRWNNELSEVEKSIVPFINFLKKRFPQIPIEREDERFTSKLAFNAMLEGGLKKKQRANKETIDKVSATIILQSFLERKQGFST